MFRVLDVEFSEPTSERRRERLLANVGGRIHVREEAEFGVARNGLKVATFNDEERIVLADDGADSLENVRLGEVDLVDEQPVAFGPRLDESTFFEAERFRGFFGGRKESFLGSFQLLCEGFPFVDCFGIECGLHRLAS